MSQDKNFRTTRGKLLEIIEKFLLDNPTITASNLGWKSIADAQLVHRLRRGGDITTKKMDAVLVFMQTHKGKRNETCK